MWLHGASASLHYVLCLWCWSCLNSFNTVDTDEAVNQDVDTDNDHEEDVVDYSNDEEDNV